MQLKLGIVALSVMATLLLAGGNTAAAESQSTDKKDDQKTEKSEAKAPEKVTAVVQAGDSLSAIADKYKTSYIRLFNANEAVTNPDLIFAGTELRVPNEDEQLPNRFGELSAPQQAVAVSSVSYGSSTASAARGSSAGNTYAKGWCTWYAKEMRPDLPNSLGNGGQWVASARAQGIPTGTTPRVGAIAEQPGHVAYVQAVNGNQVTVSEMGYNYTPGQVHTRTVPASTFSGYIY